LHKNDVAIYALKVNKKVGKADGAWRYKERQGSFTSKQLQIWANIRKYLNASYINVGKVVEWIHLAPHDNKRFVFEKKVKIS